MSWLFSQALVEEYLEDISLDGEQSVQLNGNNTQQAYCAPDKMTGFSRLSRFGMTYRPLTENRGEELCKLYREAFLAKILVQQEKAQESKASEVKCGKKWPEWFAKLDRNTYLWKIRQCSLFEDLELSLQTWPRWGSMQNGVCWEQPMLVLTTKETESGLKPRHKLPTPTCNPHLPNLNSNTTGPKNLMQVANGEWEHLMPPKQIYPTPTVRDYKGANGFETSKKKMENGLRAHMGQLPNVVQNLEQKPIGGNLNPMWVEWLMGWPLGFTDLKPLEMGKSHYVQQQHGKS